MQTLERWGSFVTSLEEDIRDRLTFLQSFQNSSLIRIKSDSFASRSYLDYWKKKKKNYTCHPPRSENIVSILSIWILASRRASF